MAALAWAGAASAATSTTTTGPIAIRLANATTTDPYYFTTNYCSATPYVQWTYDGTLGSLFTSALSLWATTSSSCGTSPGANDIVYTSVPAVTFVATRSGQFQISIYKLPGFTSSASDAGTVACGDTGVTLQQKICGAISYQTYVGATATTYQADELTLVYDTQPPTAPTISSSSSIDSAATVNFTIDSDTQSVESRYRLSDGGDWRDGPSTSTSSATKLTVTGLTNYDTYDVQLFAVDQAGNLSDGSSIVQVTPVHLRGFYEVAVDSGSTEKGGGCSATGASGLPLASLLTVLAVGAARRRRGGRP